MDQLLSRIVGDNCDLWLNLVRHQRLIDKEAGLRVRASPPPLATLALTDLSHAFVAGAKCTHYRVGASGDSDPCDLILTLGSAALAFRVLEEMDWESERQHHDPRALMLHGGKLTIHRSALPGKRVFSPLHLHRLKPLSAAPTRWTIPHVIRALVNGQFTDLRCQGRYTDDYSRDAACDFGKGEILNATAFAQEIVESPIGWRCRGDQEGRVSVCCHHFDSNSFRLNLAARSSAPLQELCSA